MPAKKWFTMAARADDPTVADIAIYDYIGYWPTDAAHFRDELAALPNTVTTIHLRINSPGGDVYQGVAMHNMLARHPANIIVTIDGMAASIASLIAMAGKEIIMPENSAMLIHNPSGYAQGTAEDLDQVAGWLRQIGQSVTNSYVSANRKQLARSEIEAMLAAETWMTAQEAVDKGFADKVVQPVELRMAFDIESTGFQKTPAFLMQKPGPPVKWVAADEDLISIYRADDPADFTAAAAGTAILEAAGFKDGATPDPGKARPGFLFQNEAAPTLPASYRMPIATLVGGELRITAAALDAAAAELDADTVLDAETKAGAAATLAGHRKMLAVLKANMPAPAQDAAARLAAEAAATRSTEILAACELAGVTAKQAREYVDGGKSLDEVRALLLVAGSGGTGRSSDDINTHNPGGSGGNDPSPQAGWDKAIARANANRKRAHA